MLDGLDEPCVLDIKLGQRLYDDDADEAKRQKMIKQTQETTSGSLGLRICGAKVRFRLPKKRR